MSTEHSQFFATEQNLSLFRKLQRLLSERPAQKAGTLDVGPYLEQILKMIVNNAQRFDELCQVNIELIGLGFISSAQNYQPQAVDAADAVADLFSMAYRFLCELEFVSPGDLSMELRRVKTFVNTNLQSFPDGLRHQLIYANYIMPADIVRTMLHHPDMAAIRDYNERYTSASTLKKQWDEELAQKEKQVQVLKERLENLETGFNFVGLVKGFGQLSNQKREEKKTAFNSLLILGGLALAPVLAEALFIGLYRDKLDSYQQALLFALPPLITIEVLLIYFFRVVLIHFRSIKAQLLQLELRTSLCQFIQSYSSFATEIKQKDASALEKFENLIFSGLISNEENLPSTFDGTEQLVKLIKSIKSSS